MDLKDTTVILFHGGTYGKYLYWVLNNFTTKGLQDDTCLNLDKNGSSHNQIINGVLNPPYNICDQRNWKRYKDSNKFIPFYAHHLIEGSDTAYDDELWRIGARAEVIDVSRTIDKAILIQSGPQNTLQALNDAFEKTFQNPVDYFNIMNRFEDFKVDTSDVSAVRELLSYKLFYQDYRLPVNGIIKNVLPIVLDDLIFSFKDTIDDILWFLETELTADMDVLLANHKKMMSLQKHLHKDYQIKTFLECFEQEKGCSLPENCTIIDEAYIQMHLRNNLNLEIKCHGLINFPSTTTELHTITYPAEEMTK